MSALVGRDVEIAALRSALTEAAGGRLAALFLTGDAGVGKTRLVTELVAQAADEDAAVLAGAAMDIAESPPFWPVVSGLRALLRSGRGPWASQLLAPWADQLDELLALRPAVPALDAPLVRVQTLELLHRVVARLAEQSVVVLVVEDLQWVDRSTRDLLTYLIANLTAQRVLVVGTHRTEQRSDTSAVRTMISELGRHRQVRTLAVAPLSRPAVGELVAATAPDRPELTELVWNRSAGNAFIAEETLRAALDGDRSALPETLRDLVLARLARLSDAAGAAVRAIALCDGPLPHRLLAAVCQDEPNLLDALREAVDAGVVVTDGDSYRLCHGLLTDVLVAELLPGERLDLHRRYAVALGSGQAGRLPGVEARCAHHWQAAGETGPALTAVVAAARAAGRVRGYAEAHRHWLRAARLAGALADSGETGAVPEVTREACLERAAETAHLAGDPDQAVALLSERLSGEPGQANQEYTAALHARTAEYLVAAGRGAEAALAFERATALLPARGAERERAEVLGGRAAALRVAGDLTAARETAQRVLDMARRLGLPAVQARALTTLGFSLAYLEDPAAGERALTEALDVAERAGDPVEIGRAHRGLAELLSGPLNEPDRGVAMARAGAARMAQLGLARGTGVGLLSVAANGLFRLGRWDEADDVIARAWELLPSGAEALELRLSRARLSTGRGFFDAAEDDLEAVDLLSTASLGPRFRIPLLTLGAGLAMWRFRPDLALDHVAAGLDVVEQGSDDLWLVAPLIWHGARARAELVRLGVRRSGDNGADGLDARLRRHADDLAVRAGSAVPAVRVNVEASVLMCTAEDSRAAGRSDARAWERVVDAWTAIGQPYPTAYAHLRLAEALLTGRANSAAGVVALREAARIAGTLGATPMLAEISDLADRARVRLDEPVAEAVPAAPSDGADDELAALTARELEVLTELADGLTNREIAGRLFISEKTVGVHVSRIYAKIGVHSRVQASAVLLRNRPPGQRRR